MDNSVAIDTSVRNSLAEHPDEYWEKLSLTQRFLSPPARNDDQTNDCTRFVIISDTHGMHRKIKNIPKGDVLVHAGDFTMRGEVSSITDLSVFFAELNFPQTLCIAGNHDISFHKSFYEANWDKFYSRKPDLVGARQHLTHCTYLEDTSCFIKKGNLEVYGSPWTPAYFDWAFMERRGEPIRKLWEKIPLSTDILITHGPPLGRGDFTVCHVRAGCSDLLEVVQDKVKPRLHIFGHIHEGHGVSYDGTTLFVNASTLDVEYRGCQDCVVVDVPHDRSKPAIVVVKDPMHKDGV